MPKKYNITKAAIKRRAAFMSKWWKNPKNKKKQTKMLSNRMTKFWSDPERSAKLRRIARKNGRKMSALPRTKEWCENIAKTLTGRKRPPYSKEWRENLRKSNLGVKHQLKMYERGSLENELIYYFEEIIKKRSLVPQEISKIPQYEFSLKEIKKYGEKKGWNVTTVLRGLRSMREKNIIFPVRLPNKGYKHSGELSRISSYFYNHNKVWLKKHGQDKVCPYCGGGYSGEKCPSCGVKE